MKSKIINAYKTGIGWGLTMYILMVFVWPYTNHEPITTQSILIGFTAWIAIGSFLFGYLMNLKLFKKDD